MVDTQRTPMPTAFQRRKVVASDEARTKRKEWTMRERCRRRGGRWWKWRRRWRKKREKKKKGMQKEVLIERGWSVRQW